MLYFVPPELRLFQNAGVLKPVLLANPQAQPSLISGESGATRIWLNSPLFRCLLADGESD